jgi:hypothetical protein
MGLTTSNMRNPIYNIGSFRFNLTDIIKNNQFIKLNNIDVIIRSEDGYINVTQLCKAGNKFVKDWTKLKQSKAYLQSLSSFILIIS